MNLLNLKKLASSGLLLAIVGLSATTVSAIPYNIHADNDLLGYVVPGTPADTASATFQANRLISLYNVPSGNGLYAPPVGDPTAAFAYVLDIGSNIPAPSLATVTGGTKFDTSNTTISLLSGPLTWVVGKYGNDNFLFYVGGVNYGVVTSLVLPTQIQFDIDLGETTGNGRPKDTKVGGGLSHYVTYGGGRTQVPDSASTLLLIGLGLASVGFVARRRKA